MNIFNKVLFLYWYFARNKNHQLINKFFLKLINLTGNIYFRIYCHVLPLKQKLDRDNSEIIISFTSIPSRVDLIWCLLESLFRQTILPNRIILYLSLKQFNNTSQILKKFKKYIDLGLEILFVEEDLGPHKKYFYTFSSYPKSKVITVDDDLIYHCDFIENLISFNQNTYAVVGNVYCDYLFLDEYGNKNKYSIPIGAGGIMYDVCKLNLSFMLNRDSIIKTSLYQDDLWLYFNNINSKVNICYYRDEYLIFPCIHLSSFSKKPTLTNLNVLKDGNQIAYMRIMKHFKTLNMK
jgi:hypothetical protein